jgi:4-hydroxybenzoate polyprenyltransferase
MSAAFALKPYLALTRLDKPVGIGLLLWPTLWALWLAAEGPPALPTLIIFLGGVVLTRSAGCAINDYADRDFDGHVARTQHRPLATGALTPRAALLTAGALTGLAFVLVLFTNALTITLAPVAVVLAALYPFTKRFLPVPQLFLAAAFSWAIPMAYAAVMNSLPSSLWWLVAANMLWTFAYDTEYAMVDRPWDEAVGIQSTARLFGRFDRLAIGLAFVGALLCLFQAGLSHGVAWPFYAGLTLAAGHALYQLWLIRHQDLDASFLAFRSNNFFGALIFLAIVLATAVAP